MSGIVEEADLRAAAKTLAATFQKHVASAGNVGVQARMALALIEPFFVAYGHELNRGSEAKDILAGVTASGAMMSGNVVSERFSCCPGCTERGIELAMTIFRLSLAAHFGGARATEDDLAKVALLEAATATIPRRPGGRA